MDKEITKQDIMYLHLKEIQKTLVHLSLDIQSYLDIYDDEEMEDDLE